jgi:arylsulfatase A-like enzyme
MRTIRRGGVRAAVALLCLASGIASAAEPPRPNIIFVLADNLGFGDLGVNGSLHHRTPHIDRLAADGIRLNSFYSVSGVCTPSRAGLMTGCYPRRVNLHVSGSGSAVLRAVDPKGLHPEEVTLAELLKPAGYHSICLGKWHLGDQDPFLPIQQGFDEFFGIPYSDDMTRDKQPDTWPELPLMEGNRVVEAPPDRDYLTQRYTQRAIRFITTNKDRPFLLYMPQAMPGSTKDPFASPPFKDQSANGHYGDSVEELDWSLGKILDTLRELQLEHKTLVVWTSDNGAVNRHPPQGSNAPFKGMAYNTSEGAMRMPCFVRWPGRIPAGQVSWELTTMMDWYVTFAALAGVPLPAGRVIDGKDIRPILFGQPDARSPHEAFFYYHMHQLQAVRSGPWKLYLPLDNKHTTLGSPKKAPQPTPAMLFNVVDDIAEVHDRAADHPDLVQRMLRHAEQARQDLGDLDRPGVGQRPAGWVEKPVPLRMENLPLPPSL